MKPKPAARKMISQNVFQVSILDMHLERKRNLVIKIIGARKTNKTIKNGQETCIDTSPRRIYRGPRDIGTDAEHHQPSDRCKLKPR